MKYSVSVVALLVAAISSQSLPNIPECSLTCFTDALTKDGCSSLTDFKCHCSKPSLISSIQPCVQKACNAKDQQSVIKTVQDTCSSIGSPISIPSSGGASTAASSAASAVSSAESAASSSVAAATSSVAAATSSIAAGISSAVSGAAGPTAAPSATAPSNGTSSVLPFTGAAASQPTAAYGAVAAVALFAAYAI